IRPITLRFSPRLGRSPLTRALRNSKAATALLDGPSHSSAVKGVTRSTQTLASSGPCHHTLSVRFHFGDLGVIAAYCGLGRDRKIGVGVRIDEPETTRRITHDLMLLGAAQIGDKPDDAVVAVGRASSGRARIPVAERVVNMQTSTRSMASQTRSSESCFAMRG